ncbi:hypothetical protein ACE10Z_28570 [Bradyrhizobium sp. Pha-3]
MRNVTSGTVSLGPMDAAAVKQDDLPLGFVQCAIIRLVLSIGGLGVQG